MINNLCTSCGKSIPVLSQTQYICINCLTNKFNENNGCSTNL